MRDAMRAIESFIFPFDGITSKVHAVVFIRYRYASLVAVALYASAFSPPETPSGSPAIISSSRRSSSPPWASARSGVSSRASWASSNLLTTASSAHPEFSPASKPIAELSGLVVGLSFGRLADYFRVVEREIKKRMATEEAFARRSPRKSLLLRELHHRVKNNLNVMKSLVSLQRNRSSNVEFLEAADELTNRIFAISLVHDQLYVDQKLSAIDPSRYIGALVANLASGLGLESFAHRAVDGSRRPAHSVDSAISLGLIVNEVLMNSLKHASPAREGRPSIRSLRRKAGNTASRYATMAPVLGLTDRATIARAVWA